jgi:DNA-binding protein HU-beta
MSVKAMSKSQIISELANVNNTPRVEIVKFWNSFNQLALEQVKKTGQFRVLDLGKLKIRLNKARTLRNPSTGKIINIPNRTVVKFTVAESVKNLIK